jgi:hypothetical protein
LLLGTGVAEAAPGSDATVAADAVAVQPMQLGGTAADCPNGSTVTGGGIGYTGFTPGSLPAQVVLSEPSAGVVAPVLQDGAKAGIWVASIWSLSGLILEPTVFALCSANSDAVVEAESFVVPGATSIGARATCPSGTRAIGGGVAEFQNYVITELSGPLDETELTSNVVDGDVARAWYAYVYNASGVTADAKVFALCSAGSDAIVEATAFNVNQNTSDAAVATCPDGRRAVGGGIGTDDGPLTNGGPFGYREIMSHPVDETGGVFNTRDGDVARGWRSAIWDQSGGGRTFKALALCVHDPSNDEGPGPGPDPDPGPEPGDGKPPRCDGKRATLVGTAKRNHLRGTRHADVIVALGGNDVINAGGGNDLVCAGSGNDRVAGGSGNDRLLGGSGADRLVGNKGRDRCSGGPGRDRARCEHKS